MAGWGPRFAAWAGPRMGIRARSALVAVVVVSLALVAGGSGLVYALQASLEQAAQSNGRDRAGSLAALLEQEGVEPVSASLAEDASSGQFVQLVDANGAVVGWSDRRVASRPLSPQRPAVGEFLTTELDSDSLGQRGEWTVVSTAVVADGETYVVQVAVPIRVQRQTVQTVASFLLGVSPLLLAAVAAAVWLLVGRALRAVEVVRGEVAAIDEHQLSRRVAVPPSRDELAALATTMNAMLDRLQASNQLQRAFVSDASHELRSPLATLSTAAELALDADESTRTRLLSTINAELTRMRSLVEDLMTLARADSQDRVLRRAEVDLDDLIDAELRRLRATSRLQVEGIVQPVRVWADQRGLAQTLRNLLDNAERHARTAIRLSLGVEGADAVLAVENDGPPVPVADRERIFDRFVRLDASRSRDAGGSGLGLAIARTAVRAQGGDVVATEGRAGWCRFELRLPLADAGVADPSRIVAPAAPALPASQQAG